MRTRLLTATVSLSLVFSLAACGGDDTIPPHDHPHDHPGADAGPSPDGASEVDAAPEFDAAPLFMPMSGLYELTTENFPDMADPEGCSTAAPGESDPIFASMTAGADTLSLSIVGQTVVCERDAMEFTCPTQVAYSYPGGNEVRRYTTLSGTFSSETEFTTTNTILIECSGGSCAAQQAGQGVTEFPCEYPAASAGSYYGP